MKCGYGHCLHGGDVSKEEGVLVGKRYYHKDCLQEKNNIQAVLDLYVERVDHAPVFSYLRKTVNDIVYKHDVDAGFLLFALRYYLDAGKRLNYPSGLYYVVKDKGAIDAWTKKSVKKIEFPKPEDDGGASFKYKAKKTPGFEDILR